MTDDHNAFAGDDEAVFGDEREAEQPARPQPEDESEGGQAADTPEGDGEEQPEGEERPSDPKGERRPGPVPYERFKQQNEELKEQRRLNALADQRLNALIGSLQQRQQPSQPEPAKQPSYEEEMERLTKAGDYVGIVALQDRQIRQFNEYRQGETQRQQQVREQNELADRVFRASKADLQRAVSDDPTVGDAYHFMREQGFRQLVEVEGMDEQAAAVALNRYEFETFHSVLRQGGSVAEYVRRFAASRGFAPQARQQPQAEPPQAPSPDRRKQHMSLSQLGGAEAPSRITAKDLAKMSEDDFAKLSDNVLNGLMQGGKT